LHLYLCILTLILKVKIMILCAIEKAKVYMFTTNIPPV
jgi:hypothetical protein